MRASMVVGTASIPLSAAVCTTAVPMVLMLLLLVRVLCAEKVIEHGHRAPAAKLAGLDHRGLTVAVESQVLAAEQQGGQAMPARARSPVTLDHPDRGLRDPDLMLPGTEVQPLDPATTACWRPA